MQAYMKSTMPYLGIPTPLRQKVCNRVFAANILQASAAWREACLAIWRNAQYREERYAAIDLAEYRLYDEFQTLSTLPMYEEMIVDGAWWDYVDRIASRRFGLLLRRYPRQLRQKMLNWSRSRNLWKRRTSILCQLGFGEQTDLTLLYACIAPSLASREFFLCKAIGWALRQLAWSNPGEVIRYVRTHRDELSSLSIREATRNISGRSVFRDRQ
jgi:3-methyladenine DNA glycosylase AlkD